MGWFSKGKKESSKEKLDRLRRIERRKDRRAARLAPKMYSSSRHPRDKPHGWFF
jgi:hypothetical protein